MLIAAGGVLFAKYVQMQLVLGRQYELRASRQHLDTIPLSGSRGRLYDRFGRLLTVNSSACSILVWPKDIRRLDLEDPLVASGNRKPRVERLAAIIGRFGLADADSFRLVLKRRDKWFCFRSGVDYLVGESLHAVLVRNQLHDYTLVREEHRRRYPYGAAFSNLLGYVQPGDRLEGRAGFELAFDSLLAGRGGWAQVQKDRLGRRLPDPSYERRDPKPGADFRLTLDADFQQAAYRALEQSVRGLSARHGSAVVLDARTGAILALADYPGYDPERYAGENPRHFRCATLADQFEPGSSFKIVVAATALESERAAELTARSYDVSAGYIQIGKYRINDVHNNGVLDFDGLLVKSSNPGCALLSMEVDPAHYHRVARALGFGYPVGLGLPGETGGRLDPPGKLNTLRLANIAFGQGLTVNLLQLAAAYGCIASGGEYLRPYLVERAWAGRDTFHRQDPVAVRRALKPATAERLRQILARAVAEGTARQAAIEGVTVGGKTGTAQKVDPLTRTYSTRQSRMTFAGFFPVEAPRYVMAVMVDEPGVGRFASEVACPLFRQIGTEILRIEDSRENLARVMAANRGRR
ncbi:MAG: penicillin-binding protein 2 [bacterium]